MNPEVDRLFEEASQLSPDQRREFLEIHATDADVRREVLSLLAHDQFAQPFFQAAIQSAAASVLTDMALPAGARIGAFTNVRMVGRGGMGAVYLAQRADGGFEQTVAIKVIQSFNPAPPGDCCIQLVWACNAAAAIQAPAQSCEIFPGPVTGKSLGAVRSPRREGTVLRLRAQEQTTCQSH
jgi:eukaryotic-like serine/threonine-protein kinase